MKYKWYLQNNYPFNNENVRLSRFIMNYNGNDIVDHINNNTLDNRKCNLRIVTHQQNSMNKKSSKNSTSKYIGVSKNHNKWQANIRINGNLLYLGKFNTEIEAAKVRDTATKEHFGEYGNLNFD